MFPSLPWTLPTTYTVDLRSAKLFTILQDTSQARLQLPGDNGIELPNPLYPVVFASGTV